MQVKPRKKLSSLGLIVATALILGGHAFIGHATPASEESQSLAVATVPANPFTGTYTGSFHVTQGPNIGKTGNATLTVISDGTVSLALAPGNGLATTFSGAISNTGVFALNNTTTGVTAISGRLTATATAVTGTGTVLSSTGNRATLTFSKPIAANLFAGHYTGTFHVSQGDGAGATGSLSLVVNSDGSATLTNQITGGSENTAGKINSDGTFVFTHTDSDGTVTTFSGKLTVSGSTITGTGTWHNTAGQSGTVTLSKSIAASPFAGHYTGSYRINTGPDTGASGPVTLIVNSDSTATMTFQTTDGNSVGVVSKVNSDGTFVFTHYSSDGTALTFSGQLSVSGSTVTGSGTAHDTGAGGDAATFTLHKG